MFSISKLFRAGGAQPPYAKAVDELADWANGKYEHYFTAVAVAQSPVYQRIKTDWTPEQRIELVGYLVERIHRDRGSSPYQADRKKGWRFLLPKQLLSALLRNRLVTGEADAVRMGKWFLSHQATSYSGSVFHWPVAAWLNDLRKFREEIDRPFGPDLEALLRSVEKRMQKDLGQTYGSTTTEAQQLIKLRALLGAGEEATATEPFRFSETDGFGAAANDLLAAHWPEDTLFPLLHQAATASGGQPTGKFRQAGQKLLAELDAARLGAMLSRLFETAIATSLTESRRSIILVSKFRFAPPNQIALKGLAWLAAELDDPQLSVLLSRLAESAYRKIPGQGASAESLGNACLWALAHTGGSHSISQLAGLLHRAKQTKVRKLIDRYLSAAATERGVSRAEIEELLVPDHGLRVDVVAVPVDTYTAELRLEKPGRVVLNWTDATGRTQKSIPAALKREYATELDRVKQIQQALTQDSARQKERLDWNFRLDRSFSKAYFDEHYLGNGLLRFFASRLIWTFSDPDRAVPLDAILAEAGWVTATGDPVDVSTATEVRCWHPARATAAEVVAWRHYLTEREIQQPLKQAFREVYPLTDAERVTETYSNRMAAHFLKQHQFAALARQRGWTYQLIGNFDHGMPTQACYQEWPEARLRGELIIQEVASDGDYLDSGIWSYVSTDAVRFLNRETGGPVPLTDVPPVLFSEAMRDVDLFVGVASIGNDPSWSDSGGEVQRDYWRQYAFGDLTQAAENRRLILERLLPRLKIRDVARLDEKYLTVTGKIRTYQIHLGSGNILMSPNDEYLCIVPTANPRQVTAERVYLPFEGDRILSIILSKALLLANDDRIEDPTITRQIKRWR